jgi:hypothetical protein
MFVKTCARNNNTILRWSLILKINKRRGWKPLVFEAKFASFFSTNIFYRFGVYTHGNTHVCA